MYTHIWYFRVLLLCVLYVRNDFVCLTELSKFKTIKTTYFIKKFNRWELVRHKVY